MDEKFIWYCKENPDLSFANFELVEMFWPRHGCSCFQNKHRTF